MPGGQLNAAARGLLARMLRWLDGPGDTCTTAKSAARRVCYSIATVLESSLATSLGSG
jgi:hypothetical protein